MSSLYFPKACGIKIEVCLCSGRVSVGMLLTLSLGCNFVGKTGGILLSKKLTQPCDMSKVTKLQ